MKFDNLEDKLYLNSIYMIPERIIIDHMVYIMSFISHIQLIEGV